MSRTETKQARGRWCCPACEVKCKTLAGINRHLLNRKKHPIDPGFGIYRTALELQMAAEATGDFYCAGEQLRSSLKCQRPCGECCTDS